MVKNEKYAIKRKEYNSDKTFVQIKKETHNKLKEFCVKNNLKIKDFLEKIIINSILVAIYTIKNTSYAKKIGI
jgi:hypothetical protein